MGSPISHSSWPVVHPAREDLACHDDSPNGRATGAQPEGYVAQYAHRYPSKEALHRISHVSCPASSGRLVCRYDMRRRRQPEREVSRERCGHVARAPIGQPTATLQGHRKADPRRLERGRPATNR